MIKICLYILTITLFFLSCNDIDNKPRNETINLKTDTVITEYENNEFEPITINGITLLNAKSSQCDFDSNPYKMRDRIIRKDIVDDTLILELGFPANCCIQFNPGFRYNNNTIDVIININGHRPEDVCDCNCCFGLVLYFSGINDTTFKTTLRRNEIYLSEEKYKTFPEEYEIYDGDTINRKNKYGFKVGLWKYFNDSTNKLEDIVFYSGESFFNDEWIWSEEYNPDGSIKSKNKSKTYHNKKIKGIKTPSI